VGRRVGGKVLENEIVSSWFVLFNTKTVKKQNALLLMINK
jgi:hypothetical protein